MGRARALAFGIALGATALGAAARPAAAQPACATDAGAVRVNLRTEPGRVSVRNGHGGRDLQRLQRKYGSARRAPGWHYCTVGHTSPL